MQCKDLIGRERIRDIRLHASRTVYSRAEYTTFLSQFVQPCTDSTRVGNIDGKDVCRMFLRSLLNVGTRRINNLRGTPTARGLPAPAG